MNEKLTLIKTKKQVEIVDYKSQGISLEKRTEDLLSKMTLKEKVAQMMGVWGKQDKIYLDNDGNLDYGKIRTNFKDGIGQIGRLSDANGGLSPIEMAEMANALQKYFREETRLGIPAIIHEECLHGLAAKEATSYPQPRLI